MGHDHDRWAEINDFGRKVETRARELRVCALTSGIDNHLLWAHYAGGYGGVAIEVDIPESDAKTVEYQDEFLFASDLFKTHSVDDAATRILLRKYRDWSYEGEVRVITSVPYYKLAKPIRRVVLGSRATPAVTAAAHRRCPRR